MLNNQRHKKQTSSSTEPVLNNFLWRKWSSIIDFIDSVQNFQKNVEVNNIKSISYSRAIDEQKHIMLSAKFLLKNYHFNLQMFIIRFNFQNSHGNPSSGECYCNPQSGQPNSNDTIFRGSCHRNCSIKRCS